MATITSNGSKGHHKFTLEVNETSYSLDNNTSEISFTFKLSPVVKNYDWSGWGSYISYTVTINGTNYTGTIPKYDGTSTVTLKSGTQTISHEDDGTKSISISFSVSDGAGKSYTPGNASASGSVVLTSIPRQATIDSAPDFNDENNPKITYSNAAGNSVSSLQACISLTGSNADIAYRDISKTGSEYTFNLTETERNVLRNNCTTANSRTVVFIIKTVIGNNTYYSTLTRTLSIVNATPTAGSLSYEDRNSTISAITQNNQHIVRNQSSLRVNYGSATAKKGASISNYKITFNGSTQTKYSSGYIDYGVVNISSNTTVTVIATDTRGNTVTTSATITIFDWILPSAVISLKRVNNYEDTTKLKVQANISSVNSKNAIQSIKWRSKKTSDSSWLDYTSINNNTEYSITKDKAYAWDFQVEIKDKFGTTTYNLTLGKGVPILYLDIKNLAVGINAYPSAGETLKVDGTVSGKKFINDTNNMYAPWYMYQKEIDLTSFNADTYYPVVSNQIPYGGFHRIMEATQLNSGSIPSWSTHNQGFTSVIDILSLSGGWGTTDGQTIILKDYYSFSNVKPGWYQQLTNSSRACFFLRGGGKYRLFSDFKTEWTIYTSSTTISSQTIAPTTNASSSVGNQIAFTNNIPSVPTNLSQLTNDILLSGTSLPSSASNGTVFLLY